MSDVYERIRMHLDATDQRIKFKFDDVLLRLKDLERLTTQADERAARRLEAGLLRQRELLDHRLDDIRWMIRRLVAAQREMQKTVDLVRAAVILGPEAVRYAMAWNGPPPFIASTGTAPVEPSPVAESANASAGEG